MKQRVITGAIMTAIVGAIFALRLFTNQVGIYIFDAFVGIMIIASAGEVSKVFNRSHNYNFMTIVTMFPIFVYIDLLLAITYKWSLELYFLVLLAIFVAFALISFLTAFLTKKLNLSQMSEKSYTDSYTKFCMQKGAITSFILFYPTILLNFLFLINHINDLQISVLPLNSSAINLGFMVLAMLFLTNVFTDTFAYFVGITLKGPKIWPLISPNKTYSGAIGGLLGSVVISIVLYYSFTAFPMINTLFWNSQITVLTFLLYGFFASVLSQLGGLFASWLKRKAKTKDYSTIFPGHGGFMDRLDGITFTAIFTFVFVVVMFL